MGFAVCSKVCTLDWCAVGSCVWLCDWYILPLGTCEHCLPCSAAFEFWILLFLKKNFCFCCFWKSWKSFCCAGVAIFAIDWTAQKEASDFSAIFEKFWKFLCFFSFWKKCKNEKVVKKFDRVISVFLILMFFCSPISLRAARAFLQKLFVNSESLRGPVWID